MYFPVKLEKSCTIAFDGSRFDVFRLNINNVYLGQKKSITFLGSVITASLAVKEHIEHISEKAKKTRVINFVTGASWGLHPSEALKLFRGIARPILHYA